MTSITGDNELLLAMETQEVMGASARAAAALKREADAGCDKEVPRAVANAVHHKSLGVEKTRVEGNVMVLKRKIEEMETTIASDAEAVNKRICGAFGLLMQRPSTGTENGPSTMQKDVEEKTAAAVEQLRNVMIPKCADLLESAIAAESVKAVNEIQTQVRLTGLEINKGVVKTLKNLFAKTRRYLDMVERKSKAVDVPEEQQQDQDKGKYASPLHGIMYSAFGELGEVSSTSISEAKGGVRLALLRPAPDKDPTADIVSLAYTKKVAKEVAQAMKKAGHPSACALFSEEPKRKKDHEQVASGL